MLPYENELKQNLLQLGRLQDQKKELEDQIDHIRDGVRKWMDVNKLTTFETEDDENQLWKIIINSTTRTNVNKDILPAYLNEDQMKKVFSTTTVETMKCNRVATRARSNSISAPTQNYKG